MLYTTYWITCKSHGRRLLILWHRSAKHSPKGKEQKRKTRKKKKVLSLVLSSVLVLSLSLPLFLAICAQLVEIQIVGQDV